MFPNPRRNKVGEGTLYRPNEVTPLSGDVLIDPEMEPGGGKADQRIAELRRLSGRSIESKLADIGNTVQGMERDAARSEREVAQLPFTGPQFHGKMYADPLDAATEAKLGAMSQPVSNPDGEFAIDSPRMRNLKAAGNLFPINTSPAPLPFDQGRLDEIKAKRLADEKAQYERRANMTSQESEAVKNQEERLKDRAIAVNNQGKAMQNQNERANVNVTNSAQAGKLSRESAAAGFPITPIQAGTAVDAGLYGTRMPMPGESTSREPVDPMSTVGFALNAPQQFAINQDAKAKQIVANDAAEARKGTERTAQMDLISKAAGAKLATIQQFHAAAKSLEEKAHWEAAMQDLQRETTAQLMSLGGLSPEVAAKVGGPVAPFSPAGAAPSAVGGSSIAPISPSTSRTTAMTASAAATPSGQQAIQAGMVPTEGDYYAVNPTGRAPTASEPLPSPSMDRPLPGDTNSQQAVEFKKMEDVVNRHKSAALDAVKKVDLTGPDAMYPKFTRAQNIYQAIKRSNPEIPDQALRFALAEHLGFPELINGHWNWERDFVNPAQHEPLDPADGF